MARGVGGRSPSNIQKNLKGMKYPADKSALISKAQDNEAPGEVIDILNKFDDRQYSSPADVMKEFGKVA